MNEKSWVKSFLPKLNEELQKRSSSGRRTEASAARKLPYACEIYGYSTDGTENPITSTSLYETDLIIRDVSDDGRWVPRVVIEAKLGSITTHDALTYSTKAATHKHVHPYLRYGILAGDRRDFAIPGRLVRHGAYFDFMVTWVSLEPKTEEWTNLVNLVWDEIEASRMLQQILTTTRQRSRKRHQILHRPLRLQ